MEKNKQNNQYVVYKILLMLIEGCRTLPYIFYLHIYSNIYLNINLILKICIYKLIVSIVVPNLLYAFSIFGALNYYIKTINNVQYGIEKYKKVLVYVINIILKCPEIMNVLRGMPCLEALGLVLYVGLIIYLWRDYIKSQHPFLYRVLTAIYNYCP